MNEVKTMVQIPLDLLEKLIENNSLLTSELERLKGAMNNLRAHAIDMGTDTEIPACIWDIAMEEMEKIGG